MRRRAAHRVARSRTGGSICPVAPRTGPPSEAVPAGAACRARVALELPAAAAGPAAQLAHAVEPGVEPAVEPAVEGG